MKKTLSCIASFVPIVGLVLGFILMFIAIPIMESANEGVGVAIAICSIIVLLIGVLMCWVDIIWFIIMAVKNPQLETSMKIVWGVLLYALNIFVFPVYWFIYIKKE